MMGTSSAFISRSHLLSANLSAVDRREVNWYSILLPLCEELCVPAYMNWSEEFVSPKLGYSEVRLDPCLERRGGHQKKRGCCVGNSEFRRKFSCVWR